MLVQAGFSSLSDLFGNHIVGFPTRRLTNVAKFSIASINRLRHVGDLGNVRQRRKDGKIYTRIVDYVAQLEGPQSIIGRGIAVCIPFDHFVTLVSETVKSLHFIHSTYCLAFFFAEFSQFSRCVNILHVDLHVFPF